MGSRIVDRGALERYMKTTVLCAALTLTAVASAGVVQAKGCIKRHLSAGIPSNSAWQRAWRTPANRSLEVATSNGIPTMYPHAFWPKFGALASFGPISTTKGGKPPDWPIAFSPELP
jgi:hypothetical protein